MNPAKCAEWDYINFRIATPRTYSCSEASRVNPPNNDPIDHDSLNQIWETIVEADTEKEFRDRQVATQEILAMRDDNEWG